jgi:hypothetical protein
MKKLISQGMAAPRHITQVLDSQMWGGAMPCLSVTNRAPISSYL